MKTKILDYILRTIDTELRERANQSIYPIHSGGFKFECTFFGSKSQILDKDELAEYVKSEFKMPVSVKHQWSDIVKSDYYEVTFILDEQVAKDFLNLHYDYYSKKFNVI